MTIHQLIQIAINKLSTSDSPTLDSEVLLASILKKPKEYLLMHPHRKVDPKLEKKYLTAINRRLLGWPVAYLVKQKEFYGRKFYVDKHVLIPRPETEGLVDLVLKTLEDSRFRIPDSMRILDIGTGSGNIIVTLAKNLHKGKFFASDISPKAIAVAKKNAKLHKVKITFGDGHLLEPWGKQKFDIIVANLPYLARQVDPSTRFEPVGALVAAKKGLKLYEELFKQISSLYALPSTLFLEIGRDQGRPIKKMAARLLPNFQVKTFKDLFGRTRYAVLVRPRSGESRAGQK